MKETLTHPFLGVLEWEEKYGYWSGQIHQQGGGMVDLWIEPPEDDRQGFLKRAADLCLWAVANERRILHEAVEAELYDLYLGWRQEEDPELTAEEFEDLLEWDLLKISDSDIVPVEFGYDDAGHDLFGGHGINVELDSELKYRDVELIG